MKRKILIVHKGGNAHTWCEDLLAGFLEAGCQADVAALRSHRLDERLAQMKTGRRHFENPAVIERIAGQIRQIQPDLIVLLNYVALPEEACARLRNAAGARTPIISWLADHITCFPDRTSPNLDGIYYFDSATLPLLEERYSATPARLEFLPLAANPARFPDHGLPWASRKPGLVFIGNNTPSRRTIIRDLQELGTGVSPFGPRAQAGLKFWRRRKISPAVSSGYYGAYQGVLNMLQPPNTIHGLNLRAFEVPACGGLGTYPLTPDLAKSFAPGEEIIAYTGIEDLHRQLETVISDPTRAEAIIQAGRARFIKDHTYAMRARRLLNDWPA